MSEPLWTCKYINRQARQKQMTWIPTAVTVPEIAALCIWGRRQRLKKHPETVEQEVIPRKP